jgi:hypothetical protein
MCRRCRHVSNDAVTAGYARGTAAVRTVYGRGTTLNARVLVIAEHLVAAGRVAESDPVRDDEAGINLASLHPSSSGTFCLPCQRVALMPIEQPATPACAPSRSVVRATAAQPSTTSGGAPSNAAGKPDSAVIGHRRDIRRGRSRARSDRRRQGSVNLLLGSYCARLGPAPALPSLDRLRTTGGAPHGVTDALRAQEFLVPRAPGLAIDYFAINDRCE